MSQALASMHNTSRRTAKLPVIAGVLVALAALAYGYLPPAQHVVNQGWNHWQPEAGYTWVEPQHPRQGVAWQPGQAHPSQAHVVAAGIEQRWAPEAGYRWRGQALEEGVAWVPGQVHPAYAHVIAQDAEGVWAAEPGYAFSQPGQAASEAVWQPGTPNPTYRNVVAADAEGRWVPLPGYTWEVRGQLSNVRWTPGSQHSNLPNLVALEQAGQWGPAPGYRWLNDIPGDARVVPVDAAPSAPAQDTPGQRFFKGLLKLVIGAALSKPEQDDGLLARHVGRPLAGAVRDEGLRDIASAFK